MEDEPALFDTHPIREATALANLPAHSQRSQYAQVPLNNLQRRPPSSPYPPSTDLFASASSASSATPTASTTLRFPKPEGSHLLAHWVISSSNNTMAAPSGSDDGHSLADSAYELISSTDGESQDGRGTDSLANSIDLYPRPDDVHSLSGNDAGYDDGDASSEDDNDRHDYTDSGPGPGPASGLGPRYPVRSGRPQAAMETSRNNSRLARPSSVSQTDSLWYAEHVLGHPSTQPVSRPRPRPEHSHDYEYDYASTGDISSGHTTSLARSIEFSEADVNMHLDKVAVKHTVRRFDEAETAAWARRRLMADPPQHLVATIRQTMSYRCLSNREPLRVLYVGDEGGYTDIMHKISSALLASASAPGRADQHSTGHHSGPSVYNIVPIASFGSSKVPEIDEIQLMGVTDYYIKVERCVEASEQGVADGLGRSQDDPYAAVYSLTLDSDETYRSVCSASGSTITPAWTLPHVAVFYVSGNDDARAEKTRNAAWEFMTRHAIPSIFISHVQAFDTSPLAGRWRDFVDQAAVHMCLESRDSSHPMAPQRLPIDLASFLNIDARQMNRNLAYLTGLYDPEPASEAGWEKAMERGGECQQANMSTQGADRAGLFRLLRSPGTAIKAGKEWTRSHPDSDASRLVAGLLRFLGAHGWKTAVAAAIGMFMWSTLAFVPSMQGLIVSMLAGSTPAGASNVLAATTTVSSSSAPRGLAPMASVSSVLTPAVSVAAAATAAATTATRSSLCPVPSLTPTVTISLTSTKTVKVAASAATQREQADKHSGMLLRPLQPVHARGSDADMDASAMGRAHGNRSSVPLAAVDTAAASAPSELEIKSADCSIAVYSSHEILVKVPARTKTTWLAKGAIDIDVWRGEERLRSKLSTTDEGIIIEINKKDAYGVMNVSIVTTRRPKINETFAVDFGFGQPTVARLVAAGFSLWRNTAAQAGHILDAASSMVAAASSEHARTGAGVSVSGGTKAEAGRLSWWPRQKWQKEDVAAYARHVGDMAARTARCVGQDVLSKGSRVAAVAKDGLAQRARALVDQLADRLAEVPWAEKRQRLQGQISSRAEMTVLRAQIASKLWWLRLRGKTDEHASYAAKAAKFLQEKETVREAGAGSGYSKGGDNGVFSGRSWLARPLRDSRSGKAKHGLEPATAPDTKPSAGGSFHWLRNFAMA